MAEDFATLESLPSKTAPETVSERDGEDFAIHYEEKRGWKAQRVTGKPGYDLVSRGPRGKIRYIEVKKESQLRDITYSINVLRLGKRLSNFYVYVVNVSNDPKAKKTLYVVPPNVIFPNSEPYVQLLFRVKNVRQKGVERHPLE